MTTIPQQQEQPITVRRSETHVLINQQKECIVIEGGTLLDLGLKLIEMAQPAPEIKLTDERKEQFEADAVRQFAKDHHVHPGDNSRAYIELYKHMAADKYFSTERANLAMFQLSQEYTRKIEELNKRIEELTKK